MRLSCFGWAVPAAGLAVVFVLPIAGAQGQGVTVDGRLSSAQTLAGPNYAIGANLGRQVGGNLFHSFGAFGLNNGERATFSGPATVNNVIGRVTGGAQSSIDGTVRSTIQGANLYLINPAGVVFGPNARVNVSGSFHASSADYLRFQDGARFQATNPDASTLSAAPPAAFGFLTPTPRPVTMESGARLRTTAGGTLGLVGGPVTISGGVLRAPAGTVHVTSAAGPGEVAVDPRSEAAPNVTALGPVRMERGARVVVSDRGGQHSGGSVFVRAGTLEISASRMNADNHGSGPGGEVSLRGDSAVTISDGTLIYSRALGMGRGADIGISTATGGTMVVDAATVAVGSLASGEGGALSIASGTLALRNGTLVLSTARDRGNGGAIGISADSMLLDGAETRVSSETLGAGSVGATGTPAPAGAGGRISLAGGTLTVQNSAQIGSTTTGSGAGGAIDISMTGDLSATAGHASIVTTTRGQGRGGDVRVTAAGNLVIDGGGGTHGGAEISTRSQGDGSAGSVEVRGRAITIHDGLISAGTYGRGKAGTVYVEATETLTITGTPGSEVATQISAQAERGSTGDAGKVRVQAGSLSISRDGQISSHTFASGHAGDVTVVVFGPLVIDGSGLTVLTGITSGTEGGSTGNAGNVAVNADSLVIINEGKISSQTAGTGQGGNVTVQAKSIGLRDTGLISSSTFGSGHGGNVEVRANGSIHIEGSIGQTLPTGISAQANRNRTNQGRTGNAGNVTVWADSLTILRNGQITAGTFTSGKAGDVTVDVRGTIAIDGSGATVLRSGRTVLAGITSGTEGGSAGDAGQVRVNAGSLAILNDGQISSATYGTGHAGNVSVDVPGPIVIDGSGRTILTGITSGTERGSTGDAGQVVVRAGSLTILNGGKIFSATHGTGRGGDVGVTAGSDILLAGSDSQITAASIGTERAGSILISAPRLRLRDGASVSTEAQGGNGGDITMSLGDLLHLRQSSITTSVNGALGNGGNITISNPHFVVLDRSVIRANAVGGRGGNVTIRADQFVLSADSDVTATSELNVPGEITISNPPPNLTGSLVVLASELRAAAALLHESCATQGAKLRSSLVVAGRGGQRQSVETTLPALYILNRPVGASQDLAPEALTPPLHTSVNLFTRCG